MQDIGFDKRNALFGLGTFTFLICFYFLRCGFMLLIKVYLTLTKQKYGGRKFYKILKKN